MKPILVDPARGSPAPTGHAAGGPAGEAGGSRPAPPAPLELARFLPYRLSVLSQRVSEALARVCQGRFGITLPEWRVMAALGAGRTLSAGKVAGQTRMGKVKVSRAVAALERKGLLHRTVDPRDQRAVRLRLTAEGAACHRELARVALAWERDLLSCLDPATRDALGRALHLLEERLDRPDGGEAAGR